MWGGVGKYKMRRCPSRCPGFHPVSQKDGSVDGIFSLTFSQNKCIGDFSFTFSPLTIRKFKFKAETSTNTFYCTWVQI